MKHLYTKLIVSLAALTLLTGLTKIASTVQAVNYFNMGGSVYECTDPTADGYDAIEGKCYSRCFIAETKVTMADGSLKNIENVQVGDWLKGSAGPNRVEYLVHKYNKDNIYGFNGGKKFVTDSHPFMTTEGWKSINPESTKLGHPGVDVEKLEIGDVLITENGNVEIKSIESEYAPQKVYTFGVNGTHDYYADGYLVHNKYADVGGLCPSGWFMINGHTIYDWTINTAVSDGCVARDLGAAVLIGPASPPGYMIDTDIMNMIYWDKNANGSYDNGTDRSLLIPTYAINTGGQTGRLYYTTPYYFTGAARRYNNSINLSQVGTYNVGISQSSVPWANLMAQGLTTNDPVVKTVYAGTGTWYITGLDVGLDFSCNGTGSETLSFTEYSCPAGYTNYGLNCRTGSTVSGGPCVTSADCTSSGTCVGGGYNPPISAFRYDDALPWNASHPNWNDRPHAPSGGDYCRNGDEGGDANPDPGTPVPCWYYPGPNGNYCGGAIGGGGCGNFVPMAGNTTYGTCSTSSSSTIPATENIVTETVSCTGTGGGGCVPNWTCTVGYTLTGDTNGDGTPNCEKTTCVTTTGSTSAYQYPFDWTQPGPLSVSCWASEDGYSNSCASSFWNINCSINGGIIASADINIEYTFRAPGDPNCLANVTIPNGSNTVFTTLSCGCSIASTPEGENVHVVSPTSMGGQWFREYFVFQSSTGVDINTDIGNCSCDAGNSAECSTSTGVTQLDGTYNWCVDNVQGAGGREYNIFGVKTPTTIGGGQTICTTDTPEATDLNNCSGCGTTTESPTVCDINDPLMAGVCYIPGGFGSTLIIKEGINAALGSSMPMVGINTSDPHEVLDVNGIVRSAQILTLSDARLKTSIGKIDSALEKIRQINGYSFEWKKDGKPDFGVLAQEIEKIFKNAVDTDVDGLKTVQYTALLAPIIEAIHEINTQIETLSNEKFDAQSKRIEAIEARIQ